MPSSFKAVKKKKKEKTVRKNPSRSASSPPVSKHGLFDDDEDDSIGTIIGAQQSLTVNKRYAEKFKYEKERQELEALKEKHGDTDKVDDDESSESEDDSDAEQITPQTETEFLRTLSLLKNNDDRIHDSKHNFFEEPNKDFIEQSSERKKKEAKPMYLKDHERKRLLTKGVLAGVSDDEDDDDKNEIEKKGGDLDDLSIVEQQKRSKQMFLKAVEDGENGDEGFLSVKTKTSEEIQAEEQDYKSWLQDEKVIQDQTMREEMEPLKRFWNDPKLSDEDKFLRDYIVERKWIEKPNHVRDRVVLEAAEEIDSEDEVVVEASDKFERDLNFRFEEEGGNKIMTHPRKIQSSVRLSSDSRKRQRDNTKRAREEEKARKAEEIKRLKNLKQREIKKQMKQIESIIGPGIESIGGLDVEGDFDPEAYDRQMEKLFNEGYYDEKEDGFQPEEEWQEPDYEDPNFNMDADYVDNSYASNGSKSESFSLNEKAELKQIGGKIKALHNELHEIDYEDVISDGLTTRFKYRKVPKNDFGLSVDEILEADDTELNQWASLKKITKYRALEKEKNDIKRYRKKSKNINKKLNILSSLQKKVSTDGVSKRGRSKRVKDQKTKKTKKSQDQSENSQSSTKVSAERLAAYRTEKKSHKKK